MAHMVFGSSSRVDGVLASPGVDGVWSYPHTATEEPGPTRRKFCETRRALIWIYRREWAALSIVS